MNDLPEVELLAQCRRGQAEAWDELFKRHYAPAGRFVFQLAADFTREDVEEICQETFLAVIRSLDTFKGTSAFQTWLFRVAANKARDHRERQHAAKRGGGKAPVSLNAEDPESGLALDPPSPLPAPDQLLQREENLRLLLGAVERLEDPCREIVQLRYFGDLSYEEIAASLSLNVKTVSSRLSKCLDRLEALARAIFSGKKLAPLPSNPQAV
jgi:RNA polymerase sigma-70 factor (ECF subfamily)